jgi:hypothetical protein
VRIDLFGLKHRQRRDGICGGDESPKGQQFQKGRLKRSGTIKWLEDLEKYGHDWGGQNGADACIEADGEYVPEKEIALDMIARVKNDGWELRFDM